MKLNITFRHMEHTPALDTIIKDKSEKFTKWLGPNPDVRWTCWKEGHEFASEVAITSGTTEYFAKATDTDLYKTFDHIVQKIQNQINK